MPVELGAGVLVTINSSRGSIMSGRVLIITDHAMIVAVAKDRSVTLRRDVASTKPLQWCYGGLPVSVRAVEPPAPDFGDRLRALRDRLDRRELP